MPRKILAYYQGDSSVTDSVGSNNASFILGPSAAAAYTGGVFWRAFELTSGISASSYTRWSALKIHNLDQYGIITAKYFELQFYVYCDSAAELPDIVLSIADQNTENQLLDIVLDVTNFETYIVNVATDDTQTYDFVPAADTWYKINVVYNNGQWDLTIDDELQIPDAYISYNPPTDSCLIFNTSRTTIEANYAKSLRVDDIKLYTNIDSYTYIACGHDEYDTTKGQIYGSDDGITWTKTLDLWDGNIWTICQCGSFYIVGTNQGIYTTTDLENLTQVVSGGTWLKVIYSSRLNLYIAVGTPVSFEFADPTYGMNINPRIMTSSDGINWTTRFDDHTYKNNLNEDDYFFCDVFDGSDKLLARIETWSGDSGAHAIAYSLDGITWEWVPGTYYVQYMNSSLEYSDIFSRYFCGGESSNWSTDGLGGEYTGFWNPNYPALFGGSDYSWYGNNVEFNSFLWFILYNGQIRRTDVIDELTTVQTLPQSSSAYVLKKTSDLLFVSHFYYWIFNYVYVYTGGSFQQIVVDSRNYGVDSSYYSFTDIIKYDDTPTPAEEDYMLKLMWEKVTMGFKKETTAYTAETLAVTDYDNRAYDIKVSPNIEMYATKYSRGDFSKEVDIPGREMATVSFTVDIYPGSAVNVAPKYFEMFECCGYKQTAFGATGISLTPNADYTNVPATIEVVYPQEGTTPSQIVFKVIGAMGKVRIENSQVGQPCKAIFEFTGALSGVTTRAYGSILIPTGFDTSRAPALLAATFSLFGTWQYPSKFTIDGGEVVELHTNIARASGYEGAHISNREVTMECDPDMDVTSSLDLFTNHRNTTTGQLSITIGGAVPLYITAPAVQIEESYIPEAREGHLVNNLKLKLKRSTNGNDELELLMGSKS